MGTGKADFIKIAHLLVRERGNEQGGERDREREGANKGEPNKTVCPYWNNLFPLFCDDVHVRAGVHAPRSDGRRIGADRLAGEPAAGGGNLQGTPRGGGRRRKCARSK